MVSSPRRTNPKLLRRGQPPLPEALRLSYRAATVGNVTSAIDTRVAAIADAALAEQQFVAATDVLVGLGLLFEDKVSMWRMGLISSLDRCLRADLAEAVDALNALRNWAQGQRLSPWETLSAGLRFTADRDLEAERIFWTRWAPAELPVPDPPPHGFENPRVREAEHAFECGTCEQSRDFLLNDKLDGVCLECTGLGHLVFLPSGDSALTRHTRKASRTSAEVFRLVRRRYPGVRDERQGILTELWAVERAAQQCLAEPAKPDGRGTVDAALRRSIDESIRTTFPGCPSARAHAIAYHAAVRGRRPSARQEAAHPKSVHLAVAESARRIDTDYEEQVLRGVHPNRAEQQVQGLVDDILDTWRSGAILLD